LHIHLFYICCMQTEDKVIIVYFFPIFRDDTMARWAENVGGNHDKKEYSVSFIGKKIEESFKTQISKNISVDCLGNFFMPGMFFSLVKYFRKKHPDIFVSASPHINTLVVIAKIISGVKTKIVLTEHNNFSFFAITARSSYRRFVAKYILPYFMRIFYPLSDAIICVSKGVAEDLIKIIKYKNKVEIIYNPAQNNRIYELMEESVNHPYFLNPKIPIILAAGRLVRQKDYPTLFLAFKLIIKKMPARLVILGEGSEREKLEKLVLQLGISENVVFLGYQKNPYKYMKNASIFVLSSIEEGFGNVIVEAMACGTPVVSTNCKSGPGEIIENNKNGILVPVGDYKALSEAIIRVFESHSLRQTLSIEGAKRAKYFSAEKSVREYEKVFKKIMKCR